MNDECRPDDLATEAKTIGAGESTAPGPLPCEIGGYRILGRLGEGGMGIVYEAEQRSPHRRVALKVVRGGQVGDELHLRLFRREAETLARLAHPNIAAIYAADHTPDGQHYFTMELVAGQTLGAFVQERLGADRPTPDQLRQRLRLFVTICRAVNYAHQRGVIHRDLKPSNVLVTEAGDVKILDFGLARIMDAEAGEGAPMSEVGAIRGTPAYMSPEQARGDGHDLDLRTDVYSLGVILYELLAGRHPHETAGTSVVHLLRAICEEPPRPLRVTAAGAPLDADLRTLAAKALEKDADRRYQSAGALADDVERYLASQPILAHPPSTLYQLRKYVARKRGTVAALGAIALLAVALMTTLVVQSARVRQERDRATAAAAKAGAINQFLLDALGGADPWAQGSRTVTLVDALRQAQGKAHAAFRGQPLVEASVLQTIGNTLGGLAEFALADTALRAALDLRGAAAGRRGVEAAETLAALASMEIRRGRYDVAEKYAREALDVAGAVHGAASPEAASIMTDLATAVAKEGRYPEAKRLAQESLRIARAGRGGDAGKIEANSLSVLVEVALAEGDFKAMETAARERLQVVRSWGTGPSAELALSLNSLGTAQTQNNDLDGAARTLQEAVDMAVAALGEIHPEVATYRENLGGVYYRAGKLDQTARNLELVLALRRKALGDDSEPVARTLANMGTVYLKAGDLAQADRTYREAIDRLGRKLGPDHPDVGITMGGLGEVLRREKKFPEAETTLRRALAIALKAGGESNPSTQRVIGRLATLYTDWQKPALAAQYSARLAKGS